MATRALLQRGLSAHTFKKTHTTKSLQAQGSIKSINTAPLKCSEPRVSRNSRPIVGTPELSAAWVGWQGPPSTGSGEKPQGHSRGKEQNNTRHSIQSRGALAADLISRSFPPRVYNPRSRVLPSYSAHRLPQLQKMSG